MANASILLLKSSMQMQSDEDWALTVVSDGVDDRLAELLKGDDRIRYLETEAFAGDHGHTPRAYGLNRSVGDWIVLSGIDNYYVPLFVAEVRKKVEDGVGLVYWDFLLDMKGEYEAGMAYDTAMAAYEPSSDGLLLTPILNGVVHELRYSPDSDFHAVARDFVASNDIKQGAGCDDGACVAQLLAAAMRSNTVHDRPRALPPYTGHIDAQLEQSGSIDIGAVAVRRDIAQSVGFTSRHFAADLTYIRAVLDLLAVHHLETRKLSQTLYVHN